MKKKIDTVNKLEVFVGGLAEFRTSVWPDKLLVINPTFCIYSQDGLKYVAFTMGENTQTVEGLKMFLSEAIKKLGVYETKTKVHKKIRRA